MRTRIVAIALFAAVGTVTAADPPAPLVKPVAPAGASVRIRTPVAEDKGTFMQDLLHVDPKAVIEEITQIRCGYGSNIELFHYTAPDQKNMIAKNSDIGGMHIALYVDDVQAAKDYLDSKHVRTFFGPFHVGEGPAAVDRGGGHAQDAAEGARDVAPEQ